MIANSLITSMINLNGKPQASKWFKVLCEHYNRNDLVLRTCLLDCNQFRKNMFHLIFKSITNKSSCRKKSG